MFKIVTDTASDITRAEAEKMGIILASLQVTFEGENYSLETDADFKTFYSLLKKSKRLPKTSQPAPSAYLDIFEKAREQKEDVLVIALSSELSGTYSSAMSAKEMSGYENIYILDSKQATLSQRMLADYALIMRDKGKSAHETAEEIAAVSKRQVVCGLLNTLTYLKKGGRIPPSLAVIGNTLGIKPAIILRDGRIEPLGNARGFANGEKILLAELIKAEIDPEWPVYFGYSQESEKGIQFMTETAAKYKLGDVRLYPIGSVIGTHTGPGAVAIAFVRK